MVQLAKACHWSATVWALGRCGCAAAASACSCKLRLLLSFAAPQQAPTYSIDQNSVSAELLGALSQLQAWATFEASLADLVAL
jgi:hypothetical protein